MQLSAQITFGWLSELLGWALIVGGMSLALQTLGLRMPAVGLGRLAHLGNLANRVAPRRIAGHAAPERIYPTLHMDQIPADIDPQRLEFVAHLHARALEELEAADDAFCTLLADLAPLVAVTRMATAAADAPLDEPIAA